MNDVENWYYGNETTNKTDNLEKIEPEKVVLMDYEKCIKTIGLIEFLRSKVVGFLELNKTSGINEFEKEKNKEAMKTIVDEISRTVAEI